jgi:hypothetical protein
MSGFWIMIGLFIMGAQIEYGLRAIARAIAAAELARHPKGAADGRA